MVDGLLLREDARRRAVALLTEIVAGLWSVPDDEDIDLLAVGNTVAAAEDVGATMKLCEGMLEKAWRFLARAQEQH